MYSIRHVRRGHVHVHAMQGLSFGGKNGTDVSK